MTRPGFRNPETWAIREQMRAMLGALARGQASDRYPKTAHEIFSALRDEWGHLGERRLWRQLTWLVNRSYVQRIGPVRHGALYVLGYAPMRPEDERDRERTEATSNGECYRCGDELDPQRPYWCYAQCLNCYHAYKAEYGRILAGLRAERGVCVRCPKRQPVAGMLHCRECLDRVSERQRAA